MTPQPPCRELQYWLERHRRWLSDGLRNFQVYRDRDLWIAGTQIGTLALGCTFRSKREAVLHVLRSWWSAR
jgi:hypothetical protein